MKLDDIKRLWASIESYSRKEDCCAYCGALATEDEHVIPYSYLTPVNSIRRINPRSSRYVIVRSCRNCNALASSKVFQNFWEKKKYIAQRIRIKYRRKLKAPSWTPDEMDELNDKLQLHVWSEETNKKILKLRLENLDTPEVFGEIKEQL